MFEKFARIFTRRNKQMTFSDAGFLGILRVKLVHSYPHKGSYTIELSTDSKGPDETTYAQDDLGHNVRKHTFWHVCPMKIQISMCIHIFRSESSLGAFWIAKDVVSSSGQQKLIRLCRLF